MFEHCKIWKVVINLEDQYSIWPASKNTPAGWKDVGKDMLDVRYEAFAMMAMRWVVVSTVCDCVKADDADTNDKND